MCYSSRGGKPQQQSGGEGRARLGVVTKQMRLLLESREGLLSSEAAHSLVNSISLEGRSALVSALFPGEGGNS